MAPPTNVRIVPEAGTGAGTNPGPDSQLITDPNLPINPPINPPIVSSAVSAAPIVTTPIITTATQPVIVHMTTPSVSMSTPSDGGSRNNNNSRPKGASTTDRDIMIGVFASVLVAVALGVCALFLWRRKKRREEEAETRAAEESWNRYQQERQQRQLHQQQLQQPPESQQQQPQQQQPQQQQQHLGWPSSYFQNKQVERESKTQSKRFSFFSPKAKAQRPDSLTEEQYRQQQLQQQELQQPDWWGKKSPFEYYRQVPSREDIRRTSMTSLNDSMNTATMATPNGATANTSHSNLNPQQPRGRDQHQEFAEAVVRRSLETQRPDLPMQPPLQQQQQQQQLQYQQQQQFMHGNQAGSSSKWYYVKGPKQHAPAETSRQKEARSGKMEVEEINEKDAVEDDDDIEEEEEDEEEYNSSLPQRMSRPPSPPPQLPPLDLPGRLNVELHSNSPPTSQTLLPVPAPLSPLGSIFTRLARKISGASQRSSVYIPPPPPQQHQQQQASVDQTANSYIPPPRPRQQGAFPIPPRVSSMIERRSRPSTGFYDFLEAEHLGSNAPPNDHNKRQGTTTATATAMTATAPAPATATTPTPSLRQPPYQQRLATVAEGPAAASSSTSPFVPPPPTMSTTSLALPAPVIISMPPPVPRTTRPISIYDHGMTALVHANNAAVHSGWSPMYFAYQPPPASTPPPPPNFPMPPVPSSRSSTPVAAATAPSFVSPPPSSTTTTTTTTTTAATAGTAAPPPTLIPPSPALSHMSSFEYTDEPRMGGRMPRSKVQQQREK
ncbi:MAG: hypothetical protein J3Q66DRAFT_398468 [Benniella sp.]|nr:MAG: hypothetical protein J3Q66DRAFT_398468 [Benniella sp.]